MYILSIDQGTTGSTAIVIDVGDADRPRPLAKVTVDFPQHFPKSGWVEHDLEEIWQSVRQAVQGAFAQASQAAPGFSEKSIASIGITNQRETLCVFERESSKPLCRAIVWQCRRSTAICDRLKAAGAEKEVSSKTGLVLDPYFSGTKVSWLMENEPTVASALKEGRAVLGTIDTFIIHRLTGATAFVTEPSNASRTMLFDIARGTWSSSLCELLGVPSIDVLPEIKDSAGIFGQTSGLDFLPDGIPIAGVLGDQQAALAGQTCFEPGSAKCTYGTGAFLLANTGSEIKSSQEGLLTTVAWSLGGRVTYAVEGSVFVAGAAMQFLRDQLGILPSAPESERMATDVLAAPEIYFVPALAGLGAPHWNPKARGAFFGLTRGTDNNQLVRAALEGVAFSVTELLQSMAKDAGRPLAALRVDGGAAANNLLMQVQANLANVTVDRPQIIETTAFGAGLFAALGVGIYRDLNELAGARHCDRRFEPDANAAETRGNLLSGWKRAVRATEMFADDGAGR